MVPDEVLRVGLAHLQAAEFLYETRLFPDLEYTFKHALTHEVAYRSLLLERRRTLHAGIVEALERLAPDRVAEHVDRLAHHAVRGEVWGKAVTYYQQAGARAFDQAAFRGAVAEAVERIGSYREVGDHAAARRASAEEAGRLIDSLPEYVPPPLDLPSNLSPKEVADLTIPRRNY